MSAPGPEENVRRGGGTPTPDLEDSMAKTRKSNGNGNGNGNSEASDMQAKLDALKGDLESLQQHMRGLASDVGGVAAERMNTVLADAMESVQEMRERVSDWSDDNLESFRETVRNQPLAACVLSMGAGALLGAILLRR